MTALSAPPKELGEEVPWLTLAHQRLRDDGTPVLARIAWTPLAFAGDLLLAPFELIWFLTP